MSLRLKKLGEKGPSPTCPDLSMSIENVSHEALERALDRATPTDLKGKCKELEAAAPETQSSIPESMMPAQQAGPSSRRREKSRANDDSDDD